MVGDTPMNTESLQRATEAYRAGTSFLSCLDAHREFLEAPGYIDALETHALATVEIERVAR